MAAGVFAPDHLDDLTRYLPFGLVDDVLAQTRTVLRSLPSRTGAYFGLTLGVVPADRRRPGLGRLCAGLTGSAVPVVSEKALRELCRRLGPAGPHRHP